MIPESVVPVLVCVCVCACTCVCVCAHCMHVCVHVHMYECVCVRERLGKGMRMSENSSGGQLTTAMQQCTIPCITAIFLTAGNKVLVATWTRISAHTRDTHTYPASRNNGEW